MPHKRYRVEENISRSIILVESFKYSDNVCSVIDILCFLGRSLLFANSEEGGENEEDEEDDINVGVIARILAAFFLYSFINLKILFRSLILYY